MEESMEEFGVEMSKLNLKREDRAGKEDAMRMC